MIKKNLAWLMFKYWVGTILLVLSIMLVPYFPKVKQIIVSFIFIIIWFLFINTLDKGLNIKNRLAKHLLNFIFSTGLILSIYGTISCFYQMGVIS